MALSCIKYFLFVQSVSAICKEKECQGLSPKEALVLVQNRAGQVKGKAQDKRAVENKGEAAMSLDSAVELALSLSEASEGPVGDDVADYVSGTVAKVIGDDFGDVVSEKGQKAVADSVGKALGDKVDKLIPEKTQIAFANSLGMEEGGSVLTEDAVKSISQAVEQVVSGASNVVHPGHLQAAIARPVDGDIKDRGKVIADATMDSPFANATLASCVDVQPPSDWIYSTCESQLKSTDNCAKRRAGEWSDGYCAKTCGLCEILGAKSLDNGQAMPNPKSSNRTHDKSDAPSTAALSEDGNQSVAAFKDDKDLLAVSTENLSAAEREWLFAPARGMEEASLLNGQTKPNSEITNRTHDKSDVPNTAELSEDGYQKVAALKDDEAMLTFVHRQLDAIGLRATSQAELNGWVGWFSGTRATQSYAAMMSELTELPLRKWIIPK